MANKTRKRQYNSNLSKKLVQLLQLTQRTALVCDAVARVVGIDKVKAEIDSMTKERDA